LIVTLLQMKNSKLGWVERDPRFPILWKNFTAKEKGCKEKKGGKGNGEKGE
jgi:hypothetical protein